MEGIEISGGPAYITTSKTIFCCMFSFKIQYCIEPCGRQSPMISGQVVRIKDFWFRQIENVKILDLWPEHYMWLFSVKRIILLF